MAELPIPPRVPVDGDDVPQSRPLFLFFLAAFVLACAIGPVVIVHAYGNLNRGGRRDPGIVAIVVLTAGVLALPFAVVRTVRQWQRHTSLRIGEDRLQLVERRSDVVGEIPYDNVAEVVLRPQVRGAPLVLLRLVDPSRPDWIWPQPAGFRELVRSLHGCDVLICHEIGFALSSETLYRRIEARLAEYTASRTAESGSQPVP